MGAREDLLAAAKRLLLDKGYAQTSARDVASAAGASLAAIGYHYGSLQSLMNAALFQATEEWGAELFQDFSDASTEQRFEATWTRVIASFGERRQLLAAMFEVFAQADYRPDVRARVAAGFEDGRAVWPMMFHGGREDRAVGSVYQALVTGMIAQWLVDPEGAPSPEDLAHGLRTIAARLAPQDAVEP